MIVGINTGKLYPLTAEHPVKREVDPNKQGNSKEQSQQYNNKQSWPKPVVSSSLVFLAVLARFISQSYLVTISLNADLSNPTLPSITRADYNETTNKG